jgi:hypothetical protein
MTSYATLREDFLFNSDTVLIEPDWAYIYSFINNPLSKEGDELVDDFPNMVQASHKAIADSESKALDSMQE